MFFFINQQQLQQKKKCVEAMDVADDDNVGSSDDSNHSMPPARKGPKRSAAQVKSHWITNTISYTYIDIVQKFTNILIVWIFFVPSISATKKIQLR